MSDWNQIIEQCAPRIWRVCYRILRDHEAAADCVQDTFLSLLKLHDQIEVVEWEQLLVRIATRRSLDRLRQVIRHRKRIDSAVELDAIDTSGIPPDELAEASELAERLRTALAKLPEQQAEIFCLRCFDDLSYSEIAEQLRIDSSQVGAQLHRARRRLERLLDETHPAIRKE